MFKNLLDKLLDTLYPPSCVYCGERGHIVCESCSSLLTQAWSIRCPLCRRAVRECSCYAPADTDGYIALLPYGHPAVKKLIFALKDGGSRSACVLLADSMANVVRTRGWDISAVCHVPRDGRNVRHYGFDQAKLLARELSAILGIPHVPLLRRRGRRLQQKRLDIDGRRLNASGVYSSRPCEGERVLLVDDIITTGATISECAAALKLSGADRVYAASAALTLPEREGLIKRKEHENAPI